MRSLVVVAFLLAGCPEPPEKPQTAAPAAGQPAAGQPPADGAAGAGQPPGDVPAGQPPAPGAEGGATAPPKQPGGPGGPLPKFEIVQGQTVKISGTIAQASFTTGTIVIEVLRNEKDIAEPIRLNVITLDKPGPFEFEAPKDLGAITVLAYVGTAEQGPGPDGKVDYTEVLTVGSDPITGIALDLDAGAKAKKSE